MRTLLPTAGEGTAILDGTADRAAAEAEPSSGCLSARAALVGAPSCELKYRASCALLKISWSPLRKAREASTWAGATLSPPPFPSGSTLACAPGTILEAFAATALAGAGSGGSPPNNPATESRRDRFFGAPDRGRTGISIRGGSAHALTRGVYGYKVHRPPFYPGINKTRGKEGRRTADTRGHFIQLRSVTLY